MLSMPVCERRIERVSAMLLNVTPYGLETKIRIQITFLSKIVRHLRFIVSAWNGTSRLLVDVAIDGIFLAIAFCLLSPRSA